MITPTDLAEDFTRKLAESVAIYRKPETDLTVRVMLVSAELAAQAVFEHQDNPECSLDATVAVLILASIRDKFTQIIREM